MLKTFVECPKHQLKYIQNKPYSNLIGKITIGIPNLKNLF